MHIVLYLSRSLPINLKPVYCFSMKFVHQAYNIHSLLNKMVAEVESTGNALQISLS